MQRLPGAVYVVFGASGGIGSALASRLVKHEDARVLLCGRDESRLQELTSNIGGGIPLVADASQETGADAAIQKAMQDFGRVDGVANCIGNLMLKAAHVTSDDEFRTAWETNVLSAFHVLRASVKPMMRAEGGRGGSIVLFSSAVARHGVPNHEAISAAKAGVYGLALSAAATYASKNVRINCVAPGMTETPLASKITSSDSAMKASVAMHPLRRIGQPDEAAAAAEFLLSPQNSFITGQFLAVDGGLSSVKSVN